jgi:hypothetical protein
VSSFNGWCGATRGRDTAITRKHGARLLTYDKKWASLIPGNGRKTKSVKATAGIRTQRKKNGRQVDTTFLPRLFAIAAIGCARDRMPSFASFVFP